MVVEMIRELDSVVLTEDLPDHHLEKGDVGTVVLFHDNAGYEVEFMTLDGQALAVVSLSSSQIRPIAKGEIAHVRPIGAA